jgi:REP element-mobilizing transposase RayT
MARLLRLEYPGAIYHVTIRGNNRRDLFADNEDRERFLARLGEYGEEYGVRVYAFCLMANHVHMVIETPNANLGRFLHRLQTAYTVYHNLRHRQSGHLTQGRYKAKAVEGDEYLLKLARYVHLNPVFVGEVARQPMKDRRKVLRGYRWSSYRRYMGRREWGFVDEAPLLAMMPGRNVGRQRVAFRAYVECGMAETDEEFLELKEQSRLAIGGAEFCARIQDLYAGAAEISGRREDVALRRVGGHLKTETVVAAVCREMGAKRAQVGRRSRGGWLRAIVARMLVRYGGLTQREIAPVLGVGTGKAVSVHMSRLNAAAGRDRGLARQVAAIEHDLQKILNA